MTRTVQRRPATPEKARESDELNLTVLKRTRWVGITADLTLNYRRRPEIENNY